MRKRRQNLLFFLLTGLLVSVFVSLGRWQLERADYKYEAKANYEALSEAGAVSLVSALDSGKILTPVDSDGHFLGPVILHDNQIQNGAAGYHVYARFRPNGLYEDVMVQLGFLKRDFNLTDLELARGVWQVFVRHYSEHAEISGRFYRYQETAAFSSQMIEPLFRAADIECPEVVRMQQFELRDIDNVLQQAGCASDRPLWTNYFIWGTGSEARGLIQPTQMPQVSFHPEKHEAYAFQWFSFALLAIILLGIKLFHDTKRLR